MSEKISKLSCRSIVKLVFAIRLVNCDEATKEKCENSLRWEHQCPKQCDPYPHACHCKYFSSNYSSL